VYLVVLLLLSSLPWLRFTVPSAAPSPLPSPGEANTERFGNTWASVAVKMVSAYLCYALYIWTMVAPLLLGRWRDFGYADE